MMVEDIDIPGRPSDRTWYASDISTFDEIWVAAHTISNWCVGRKGRPGWTSVGK